MGGNANSYSYVLNGSKVDKPTMVIGEDCLDYKNYSLTLIGEVKDFCSLTNLRVICGNEGFEEINYDYLGGKWVSLEFYSMHANNNFLHHVGVRSWFEKLEDWKYDFELKSHVVWVEIERVPPLACTLKTFSFIVENEVRFSIWTIQMIITYIASGCASPRLKTKNL